MCLSTPYPNTASLWTISVSAHVCLYARMCVCVCFVTREVLTSHTHQEWREEEQNSFHGNCWHRVIKREGERERKNDNKKIQWEVCFTTPQHIYQRSTWDMNSNNNNEHVQFIYIRHRLWPHKHTYGKWGLKVGITPHSTGSIQTPGV